MTGKRHHHSMSEAAALLATARFLKDGMEMKAEWREELATGNESIDSSKRALFLMINGLLDACRERKAREEFGGFLDSLKQYVRNPLLEEESLQLDRGYPYFREHRAEHDRFVQRLSVVEEEFRREGATACVILAAGQLVLDWVHGHVYRADGLLARYVNN